jgi:hydroxymethylbilane synthase
LNLRIGSRGSQLALWQANHVASLLRAHGHEVDIEVIRTTGDKMSEVALSMVGTKGMFTKEIEEALVSGRVQLAVHSLKDVPTELALEFELAAILPREDARDAFVSTKYEDVHALPAGARVGTSSLRRQALLKALRPDLTVEPLRGNVDTRLRKLDTGELDAMILAHSGLKRLQRTENVRGIFEPKLMCPAPGQGALAIETLKKDEATRALVAILDDHESRASVFCERAVLNALGGGCQVPIGAHAIVHNGKLELSAVVARPDGSEVVRNQGQDDIGRWKELGERVAAQLTKLGADAILQDIYGKTVTAPEQP